jgi:hypothetical protein
LKVYVVTEGCYSDYHIEAVFTDLEQAEIYCATHKGDIEEYETDEHHFETEKKVGVCGVVLYVITKGVVLLCFLMGIPSTSSVDTKKQKMVFV